jgi:hypothetical protein
MSYMPGAAALLGAAIAAAGAWQVQGWRLGGQITQLRADHAEAVATAKREADTLRETHRAALQKADASAQKRIAAQATASLTLKREIVHAPDLDCRLPEHTRGLLNNYAHLPDTPD